MSNHDPYDGRPIITKNILIRPPAFQNQSQSTTSPCVHVGVFDGLIEVAQYDPKKEVWRVRWDLIGGIECSIREVPQYFLKPRAYDINTHHFLSAFRQDAVYELSAEKKYADAHNLMAQAAASENTAQNLGLQTGLLNNGTMHFYSARQPSSTLQENNELALRQNHRVLDELSKGYQSMLDKVALTPTPDQPVGNIPAKFIKEAASWPPKNDALDVMHSAMVDAMKTGIGAVKITPFDFNAIRRPDLYVTPPYVPIADCHISVDYAEDHGKQPVPRPAEVIAPDLLSKKLREW